MNQLLQKPSVPGGWWTGTAILLVLYCIYEQISFAASRLVSKANGLWQACFRSSVWSSMFQVQYDWHGMQASSRLQVSKGSSICCPFGWLHNRHGQEPISVLGRSEKVSFRKQQPVGKICIWFILHSNPKTICPALTVPAPAITSAIACVPQTPHDMSAPAYVDCTLSTIPALQVLLSWTFLEQPVWQVHDLHYRRSNQPQSLHLQRPRNPAHGCAPIWQEHSRRRQSCIHAWAATQGHPQVILVPFHSQGSGHICRASGWHHS